MGKKLWSGRFSGPMLPELERFASSLEMDYELYPYDVAGSLAHARGLAAARLLSKTQATAIERGLRRVKRELDEGAFKFRPTDEDIHTAIERRLTENSIDAGSDRDFALDLAYACAVLGIHLSRLGEDIVLWASAEFGFVTLADEISTGSSLMPQKKNPDVAELLRGRAARSLGSLVALATTLKGLPLAYDRDLQEDKTALFATVDNTFDCLEAAAILVEHLEFDRQRLAAAAGDPSMLATDAAEELVRGGTAFRKAHQEVAGQVREGTFATSFNAKSSVAGRDLVGGPNQRRVAARARLLRREAVALPRWGQKRPTPLHER